MEPAFDYQAEKIRATRFWVGVLFVGLLALMPIVASVAGDAKDKALMGLGFFGLIGIFCGAAAIATFQVNMKKADLEARQKAQADLEKHNFEEQMQSMAKEDKAQATLSKTAQSKQELIMRLGTIDQYIRVLEIETDVSKRTVALQAAHSEMTTLAAKLASDQISRDVLDTPDVREQALETSKDLARLGLSEDRLNRDLIRMFKLSAN